MRYEDIEDGRGPRRRMERGRSGEESGKKRRASRPRGDSDRRDSAAGVSRRQSDRRDLQAEDMDWGRDEADAWEPIWTRGPESR